MKIALVSPYDWSFPGGVRQHIADLANYLRGQGHETVILTAASAPVDDPHVWVVGNAVPLPINGSMARPGLPSWRSAREIALAKFDLMHLHEPLVSPLTLACAWFARVWDTPCVGTFHAAASAGSAWLYDLTRPLVRSAFDALDERIAVSPVAQETIARVFSGDYHLIPNGVSVAAFETPRRSSEDRATILFLGRLDPRKGVEVLLDAIPQVRTLAKVAGQQSPRFIIAGEGPQREDYMHRLRSEPGVIFTGALTEAQKLAYLTKADIFCAPSLGGESQGIVLLEALAAGATVVASSISGYQTVIDSERTGVLTPPGDVTALAEALHRVAADRALRARLAHAGRIAVQRYDWGQVGHEIEAIYASALSHHERAGDPVAKAYDYVTDLV